MNEEYREWALFILCALLVAAVMISAWMQVPELAPVKVMPASSVAAEDGLVRGDMPTEPSDAGTETINLNTATAAELTRLSGLGEKTAAKIIAYRELYGDFEVLEDLLNVEGVGEKKLESWRPFLTV